MRRSVITAILAVAIVLMAASASLAQHQITLGANGGYTFSWAELELEYKINDLGFGAQFGFGYGRVELAGFGRYYFPLNELINLAPEYELNLYAGLTPSVLLDFIPVFEAGFGLKVGPGIDFRWDHLRVGAELGYRFDTIYGISHGFYTKAGIGYRF